MTDLTEIIPAADYARVHGAAKKQGRSAVLHADFANACRARRLPDPVTEFQFAKQALKRLWKADFCWPEYHLIVEIEGLVCRKLFDGDGKAHNVVMGRHATIGGFIEDCEKYNAAALLGWTVLRFAQAQLKDGTAIDTAVRALFARGWRAGESRVMPAKVTPITPAAKPEKPEKKTKQKTAPTPRAARSNTSTPSAEGVSTATQAPELPPAVREIAATYPKGKYLPADWERAYAHIRALVDQGVEVGELEAAATLYRRQSQALGHLDTSNILPPSAFFGNEIWRGPFPMPAIKSADELESELTNEEWLRRYGK